MVVLNNVKYLTLQCFCLQRCSSDRTTSFILAVRAASKEPLIQCLLYPFHRPHSILFDMSDTREVKITLAVPPEDSQADLQTDKADLSALTTGDERHLLFCVNDPQALCVLGQSINAHDRMIQIESDSGKESTKVPLASIVAIRVAILAPLSPEVELTPEELNGGIEGPVVSTLVKSWREAFRTIPDTHALQRVEFDMRCPQRVEPRHVVRLLQEVSTVLYIKAKRQGRAMEFKAVGCEDYKGKKEWLESSLPGHGQSETPG